MDCVAVVVGVVIEKTLSIIQGSARTHKFEPGQNVDADLIRNGEVRGDWVWGSISPEQTLSCVW